MAPLSIQSGVNYAKTLLPDTLVRSVSTVQNTISRHILPAAQPRRFMICAHSSRRRRRGVEASSLDELLEQAVRVFMLTRTLLTLVLEEDGTVVDSEDFFQSLPNNTPLMVLENGERWTPNKFYRQPKRNGVAKVTFNLYKLHPKDFLGCLAIKATLYEVYTLSYNFRCTRIKHILKLALSGVTCLSRVAGQLLLYTASSLLQFTTEHDC
ncbi:cell death activator CIDE-A [Micropterus dolomieu]|uniref:cell death activator CIDE-A n=1 Tax=Micropterus dolomieu TaxID=147949 RepID=UPI001E8D57C1|nr:cell death activator CIDE-A [Micropterus dolomieu]